MVYYTYEGMLLPDSWDLVGISLTYKFCYVKLTWSVKA